MQRHDKSVSELIDYDLRRNTKVYSPKERHVVKTILHDFVNNKAMPDKDAPVMMLTWVNPEWAPV